MVARHGDQLGRGVDAGDLGAEPGERLGQQAGPAADVERALSVERPAAAFVALPMLVDHVAQIFQAHRIELVQHRLGAGGIPPVARLAGELLDLSRDDAAVGHDRAHAPKACKGEASCALGR